MRITPKSCAASTITSLALFGLILGGLWNVAPALGSGYKLTTALIAKALALVGGAIAITLSNKHNGILGPAFFGGLLSAVSFGYIFGPVPLVLLFIVAGIAMGILGGWIGQIICRLWR